MLSLSAGYLTHLQGSVTYLATLWKITRSDGQIFRFTNHDTNIFIQGDGTYSKVGYNVSSTKATSDLSTDNMTVEATFDSSAITEDDLKAGLWDGAAVEVSECIWNDLSKGTRPITKGYLGEVIYDEIRYKADLLGITTKLQLNLCRIFSPGCDANLGDTRCKKVLTNFTHNLTVTGVTDRITLVDSNLAQATGYFNFGLLTWSTGANAGVKSEIKTHTTGGNLTLFMPVLHDIAVGDTGTIVAGCDKSYATCGTKFSNEINFRGFPTVPGTDRLISIISA
jgi:uncharacterized phage protein (TIGR02218 family)